MTPEMLREAQQKRQRTRKIDESGYVPGRDRQVDDLEQHRRIRGVAVGQALQTQRQLKAIGLPVRHHFTKALRVKRPQDV